MAFTTKHGIWAGLGAAAVLLASPAAAATALQPGTLAPQTAPAMILSPFPASQFDTGAASTRWGCWNCGWGGWRGRGWRGRGWRRRGPSAGDVLAGVAIIGGIAAIAAAANNNRRNRDVVVVDRNRPRDWDRRDDRARFDDRRANPRSSGAGGLDAAVNQCLASVERDVRVDNVDAVQRTAQGWLVAGSLFNGSNFECRIGNDGRIENIDFGAGGGFGASMGAGSGANSGAQWDDARYADARRAMAPSQPTPASGFAPAGGGALAMEAAPAGTLAANGPAPLVPLSAARLPAYPGGPVEGEELPPVVQRPGIP